MLEQARKGAVKQTQTPLHPHTTPLPQPAPDAALQRAWAIQRFATRPTTVQRAALQPVLSAIRLQRQEEERLEAQAAPLQRQIGPLSASLPSDAIAGALQRQAAQSAPLQAPARPQSAGDWVTVMRAKAQSLEQKNSGRGMNPREVAELSSLQRQTAAALAQGVRTDPRPAVQRQAAFAEHAASLHGHPLTHNIPRAAIALATPGDRPGLQRALDEALQRQEALKAQDERALELHGLQRQMAELDAQATQSVYQRIQQRRGAGSPLPEAVQRHLEHGLNHDLSAVRIHDDAEADKLAKGVNALAFTTGTDIYFRSGKFNPNTQSGLELLAHEVTHTVQQSKGQVGKGIDPDSGLEQEARAMGRKLSQRRPRGSRGHGPKFGRQPGKHTAPRPSLRQAVSAGPAGLQRWGLGDLKKLASNVGGAISSKVKSVKQAAQRTVQKVVRKVASVAKPVVKAVRRVAHKAKASVRRVVRKASTRLRRVSRTVRRYASKKLSGLKRMGRRAISGVVRRAGRLKRKATGLVQRAGKTFRRAKAMAAKAYGKVRQKVSQSAGRVRKKATETFNRARKYVAQQARAGMKKVSQKARALKQGGQAFLKKAQAKAKAMTQKVGRGIAIATTAAKKAAKTGWNASVKTLGQVKNSVVKTYNAVKNNPTFKKSVKFLKEAGIQVAKVGTAIVVGGAVIAGAAALTAATGGLAGPALVMALFASGALGGAASQVVENALRGKKNKFEGISIKSMAVDGTLGVALGPVAKLVGGVARAVGRPVLKVAGKGLAAGGRAVGRGLTAAANRYNPHLVPVLRIAGLNARNRVAQGVGNLRSLPQRVMSSPRGQALKQWAQNKGQGLKNGFANSRTGRVASRVDQYVSSIYRGGKRVTGKVATKLNKSGKTITSGARQALNSVPKAKGFMRNVRSGVEKLKDKGAVARIRTSNYLSNAARRRRNNLRRFESYSRYWLSSKGLNVNTNTSLTERVLNAGERSLNSMKSYIGSEAKAISNEVREQWYGSAGVGGVLRNPDKLRELLNTNPALANAWNRERQRATKEVILAQARRLRNLAAAEGRVMTRQESRRLAAQQVSAEQIEKAAIKGASGKFVTQATRAYQAVPRVAETGFNPRQNVLAQLPRIYGAGTRQMGKDMAEKWHALRNAGGMAGAGAVSAGWLGEELFKTYSVGMADKYKGSEGWSLPTGLNEAGSDKVKADFLKNLITSQTGLIPEAQGGKLMLGAPYDRVVKSQAAIAGQNSTTVTSELQYQEPKPDKRERP